MVLTKLLSAVGGGEGAGAVGLDVGSRRRDKSPLLAAALKHWMGGASLRGCGLEFFQSSSHRVLVSSLQ